MEEKEKTQIGFNWKNIIVVFAILAVVTVAFIAFTSRSREEVEQERAVQEELSLQQSIDEIVSDMETEDSSVSGITDIIPETGGENEMTDENKIFQDTDELVVEDIITGDGQEAQSGDSVVVNYKGTLTNGTQFDSSYDRGTPFEFQLGAGRVIEGWDVGVVGMKVGGKRRLIIPSELGYGSRGAPPDIPPNATLVFEVELLEIK